MQIIEAIEKVKGYCKGTGSDGKPIDLEKTRDKILWGDPNQELTGIVVTCYASVDVIKKARELKANLIISHEALFWNHGDHTDWLQDNKTFQAKTKLLDEGGICVWRNHDFIHSGIPAIEGGWTDGIFYGLMKEMDWQPYLACDISKPMHFEFPETTVREFGEILKEKMNLKGIKVIGNPDSPVKRFWVAGHIDGRADNQILKTMEEENIDAAMTLECTDYTVAEYVRDSTMVKLPKTLLAVGHFNVEEPGMKYMLQYLPDILGKEIPYYFVPCADMYNFL